MTKKSAPKKTAATQEAKSNKGNWVLEALAGVTCPPQPFGYLTEGLDLVPAITELQREATIAQYRLLRQSIGKTQGTQVRGGIAVPMDQEVDAMLALYRHDGGRDNYGHTCNRAMTGWAAVGWIPLPSEGEGAVVPGRMKVTGPDATAIPAGSEVKPVVEFPSIMESVNRWIVDFIAEVDACCKYHLDEDGTPHEDLGAELDRLRTALEAFQWGTRTQEVLKTTPAADIIAQDMEHGRAKLLAKLKEVRDDFAPTENSTAVTLTWNGDAQELGALMNLLVERELLVKGKSMAALAKQWQATFRKANGSTMDLVQAVRNTARRNAGRIIDLADDIPKKGKSK
jgi:hypothetical protein